MELLGIVFNMLCNFFLFYWHILPIFVPAISRIWVLCATVSIRLESHKDFIFCL